MRGRNLEHNDFTSSTCFDEWKTRGPSRISRPTLNSATVESLAGDKDSAYYLMPMRESLKNIREFRARMHEYDNGNLEILMRDE